VFVLVELGRRKIPHLNVTDHPSAEWTQQQLREALPVDHPFRFLIHDRDGIFSQELDRAVAAMGVRVLRTPLQSPQANSVCERLIGTIRRECLDFLIPLGHPASEGYPQPPGPLQSRPRGHEPGTGYSGPASVLAAKTERQHRLPTGHRVRRKAVLGGLYHEYWLEKVAA
jgi:putative transposase